MGLDPYCLEEMPSNLAVAAPADAVAAVAKMTAQAEERLVAVHVQVPAKKRPAIFDHQRRKLGRSR
jgi:hypothetical protein